MTEIDLTKNQIVEDDVLVWVWDEYRETAKKGYLQSIDHRHGSPYRCWDGGRKQNEAKYTTGWKNASLTDPRIEKLPKPMWDSVDDIDWDVWECTFGAKTGWSSQQGLVCIIKDHIYSEGFAEIRQINLPENRFALRDCIRVQWPVIRCKKDIEGLDADLWGVSYKDYSIKLPSIWNYDDNSISSNFTIHHLPTGQTKQVEPDLPYALPKEKEFEVIGNTSENYADVVVKKPKKRQLKLWEIPKYLRDNPELVLVWNCDGFVHIDTPVSYSDSPENYYTIPADKLASLGRMPTIEDCDKLEVEE